MTAQKADFTDVYTQPDPRAYYRTLRALDYQIPEHGREVFSIVLDEQRAFKSSPLVLDLCCSYGVNAALLNHSVTLEELEKHYAEVDQLAVEELADWDREWFGSRRLADAVDVIGFDSSRPAIDYAVDVGLLVDGVVADLERESLSDEDVDRIAEVDLVTITGGVGYVMDRTFDQILGAATEPPWVAALVLRWVDFDPIARTFDAHGLVTEKLDGCVFSQRRFADASEAQFVIDQLSAQGIEPTPVERGGHHGAELYLARPAPQAAEVPLAELPLTDLVPGVR